MSHTELEQLARDALNVARERQNPYAITWCMWQIARDIGNQGRFTEAVALLDECASRASELDERLLFLWSLEFKSIFAARATSPDEALPLFYERLDAARSLNDGFHIALALTNIGDYFRIKAQYDEAAYHYRESINVMLKYGNERGLALAYQLGSLCKIAVLHIRLDEARSLHAKFRNAVNQANLPDSLATVFELQSRLQFISEDYSGALASIDNALSNVWQSDHKKLLEYLQGFRGAILAMLDEFHACIQTLTTYTYRENAQEVERLPIFDLIVALLYILERKELPETCTELLSAFMSDPYCVPFYTEHPYILRLHQRLQDTLDAEAYNAAWERGKALDLETTVQGLIAELSTDAG